MQAHSGAGVGISSEHPSHLPAPIRSPDGYDELTLERLRLLVNSISYEAKARAFEAEETLFARRAGSEESEAARLAAPRKTQECQHY